MGIGLEKININDIEIIGQIDQGSYSKVFEVLFNEEKYAFKCFSNEIDGKFLINKYKELNSLDLKKAVIPNIYVEDGILNGFLMKLYNHRCFSYLYEFPTDNKILALKEGKRALLEAHSREIIHGDIHPGNFLLQNSFLTDFDNSSFKNFNINFELCSAEALNFLTTYKLSKDLDIYLFNFMTFSLLNNCDYNYVESNICDKKYGIFISKDAIKICKSLLLQDKIFNSDFLIDTITFDNTKIKSKKIGRA